ncbi:MFS transporter, partial [Staphylococcus aureus]|nr:MFS transporter [Staphylococcus aureus]
WISDNWHWSGIFFINVPIGILVLWAGWPILRHRETDTFVLPVDKIGLALLVIGVGSLQIMLDKGKDLGWFGSWVIVTLAVVA